MTARSTALQAILLLGMLFPIPAFAAGHCPNPMPSDPTKIESSDFIACVQDIQHDAVEMARDVTALNARLADDAKYMAELKDSLIKRSWVLVPLSDQEQFDLLCEYRWSVRDNLNFLTYNGLAPYMFYAVGVRHDSLVASNGLRQFWIVANSRQSMYFTNRGQPDGGPEVTNHTQVDRLEKRCG